MRKPLIFAGLLSAGVLFVQTSEAQTVLNNLTFGQETIDLKNVPPDKNWKIEASVKGFYDDNINTTPSGAPGKTASWGMEMAPSGVVGINTGQLEAAIGYGYNMKYYENRSNSADHRHLAGGMVAYELSPRARIEAMNFFVVGQESDVLDPSGTFTTRVNGDNMRNLAGIGGFYELTRLLSLDVGYANYFVDYDNDGFAGSRSALLDRMEHRSSVELQWQPTDTTTGLVGYRFNVTDQTGDDPLAVLVGGNITPDSRDSRSHSPYLGVQHRFSARLSGAVRAGVQFVEFPNLARVVAAAAPAAPAPDTDLISPYAMANLAYSIGEGGSINMGASYDRSPTDLFALDANSAPTRDAGRAKVFSGISYQFTPRITGRVNAEFHHVKYNGGAGDDTVDLVFLGGGGLEYLIIKNASVFEEVSLEASYAFDRLDSDTTLRGFSRHRVYLGLNAAF